MPARDKRHVQLEGGHMPPLQDIMREVLDWLDVMSDRWRSINDKA
jgi:hypothetical protein